MEKKPTKLGIDMKIESKTVRVNASQSDVFSYVSDLNNFKELLPMDKISDWESREDFCSFKIKGTATIDLHKETVEEPSKIGLKGGEKAPFPLSLDIFLNDVDGETEVHQKIHAEVNPFLKMMVEKPLTNLFDFIAERLKEKFQ
jgi:carbon monoxide dehydrogenase subunit G